MEIILFLFTSTVKRRIISNNEKPMKHLILLSLLLFCFTIKASCMSSLRFLVSSKLHLELHFEMKLKKGASQLGKYQKVSFYNKAFSKEVEELVIETIDQISGDLKSSKVFTTSDEISVSCDSNCKSSAWHFHHLFFNQDLLNKSSRLSTQQKKAVVAHEYGHLLFNRKVSETFPDLTELWKYENKEYVQRFLEETELAERSLLKQQELLDKFIVYPIYKSLGELFADSVGVLYTGEANVFKDIVYSLKGKSVSNQSNLLENKHLYREFRKGEVDLVPEVSADTHQVFYLAREKVYPYLEKAFDNPKASEKVLGDILSAGQETLEYFFRYDPQTSETFNNFLYKIKLLKKTNQELSLSEQQSFKKIILDINRIFVEKFESKVRI